MDKMTPAVTETNSDTDEEEDAEMTSDNDDEWNEKRKEEGGSCHQINTGPFVADEHLTQRFRSSFSIHEGKRHIETQLPACSRSSVDGREVGEC